MQPPPTTNTSAGDAAQMRYVEPPPLPDQTLIDIHSAVDWIEKAPHGAMFMVEKEAAGRYRVKEFNRRRAA
jgi:hypothetical protein